MASTAENILARVQRVLAEKEAKLVSYAAVTVVREGTGTTRQSIRMTRKWERIDDLIRKDLEDYLRTYASVSNGEVAGIYVTDPWADGEIRAGRWRMIRVFSSPLKTDPNEQGIFQTLMYWPDGYGDFGDYCAQSSPLHHEDVNVFVDSPVLATAGHQNVIGHVYSATNSLDLETGLWRGEERDDEARYYGVKKGYSGNITEETERSAARNDDEAYPNSLQYAALAAAKKSVQSNFSINQYGLIDWEAAVTEKNAYPTEATGKKHIHGSVTVKETTSERINAETIPADDWPADIGVTTGLDFTITPEGLFHWTHNKRESQEYPTGGNGMSTWSHSPLSKEEKREGRNAEGTPEETDPGTYPAGSIIRTDFSINPDGLVDWNSTEETAIAYPEQPAEITFGGVMAVTNHSEKMNDLAVPVVFPGEQGFITRAEFSINRFGLYDWSIEEEEGRKPGLIEWETGNVLSPTFHQKQLNDTSHPAITAGLQGHVTNGYVDINRYGLFDWTTEDEEGVKPNAITWQTGGPLAATDHEKQLNDTSYPEMVAGEQGHITNGTISLNRFGLFDWETENEEAAKPDPIEWKTGGPMSEVSHTRQLNDTSHPDVVAGLQGHVIDARIDINRYGLFDWDTEDDEAKKPAAILWQTGGPLSSVDHTKQDNDTSYPEMVAGASGHIVSGAVSINRYGLYDWEKTDEEANPASETYQETGLQEVTDGIIFENQTEIPACPSPTGGGTPITRITARINAYGRYDGEVSTTSATAGYMTDPITVRSDSDMRIVETFYFNQSSAPGPGGESALANGLKRTTYDPSLNRFGLWDYVKSETSYFSPLGVLTTVVDYRLPGRQYSATSAWSVDEDTGKTRVVFKLMQEIEHHYLKVFTSYADAAAYINLDDVVGTQENRSGSGVRDIGNGFYMAHKVVHTMDDAE